MTEGWKRFKKFLVVGDHRGHLGLLKHDLRNPDGIGISGFSPGEVSFILLEPSKEVGLNCLFLISYLHLKIL